MRSNVAETSTKFKIIRGKYSEYKDRLKELALIHWDEVGMPGSEGLKVNMDDTLYEHLEFSNRLLGLGLLEESKGKETVIGYLSIIIYDHHQHTGTTFAQTDGFFIHPKYRGIKTFRSICDMFKKAEDILKEEYGVSYFYLGVNAANDLKFLADCLEFKRSAIMYLKRL